MSDNPNERILARMRGAPASETAGQDDPSNPNVTTRTTAPPAPSEELREAITRVIYEARPIWRREPGEPAYTWAEACAQFPAHVDEIRDIAADILDLPALAAARSAPPVRPGVEEIERVMREHIDLWWIDHEEVQIDGIPEAACAIAAALQTPARATHDLPATGAGERSAAEWHPGYSAPQVKGRSILVTIDGHPSAGMRLVSWCGDDPAYAAFPWVEPNGDNCWDADAIGAWTPAPLLPGETSLSLPPATGANKLGGAPDPKLLNALAAFFEHEIPSISGRRISTARAQKLALDIFDVLTPPKKGPPLSTLPASRELTAAEMREAAAGIAYLEGHERLALAIRALPTTAPQPETEGEPENIPRMTEEDFIAALNEIKGLTP